MPDGKRAILVKNMLVDHEVIDRALAEQNDTRIGTFLADAQKDFQLYLLISEKYDVREETYAELATNYELDIGPEHLIAMEQLELLKEDDGKTDFEAVISHRIDIAMMAREIACGAKFIEDGYDHFKSFYDCGLMQSGLWLASAEKMGSMTRCDIARLDRSVSDVLVDLNGAWKDTIGDHAVSTFLQSLRGDHLRERVQNDLKLYFNYSALQRSDLMVGAVRLIHRDLSQSTVSGDVLESALAKVEFRAKSAPRRDYA